MGKDAASDAGGVTYCLLVVCYCLLLFRWEVVVGSNRRVAIYNCLYNNSLLCESYGVGIIAKGESPANTRFKDSLSWVGLIFRHLGTGYSSAVPRSHTE